MSVSSNNGVATRSSAGRVRPCVPPDRSGAATSTAAASHASAQVASATRGAGAAATSQPVSAPSTPPATIESSTALPIGSPARSSCIAPIAPTARNALCERTGSPAKATTGTSPSAAASR